MFTGRRVIRSSGWSRSLRGWLTNVPLFSPSIHNNTQCLNTHCRKTCDQKQRLEQELARLEQQKAQVGGCKTLQ